MSAKKAHAEFVAICQIFGGMSGCSVKNGWSALSAQSRLPYETVWGRMEEKEECSMQYVTAETIRTLREKRGMTQRQLAEQLYISDKTVSKWETGVSQT